MITGKCKLHPAEYQLSFEYNSYKGLLGFFFRSPWGRWELLYQVDKKNLIQISPLGKLSEAVWRIQVLHKFKNHSEVTTD